MGNIISSTSGYNSLENILGYNTSNQGDQLTKRDTTISESQYMGCYKDKQSRDLPYVITGSGFSKDTCLKECKSHGYQYFGRQYDGQCFCGNSYGKYGPTSGCDCDGDNIGSWKNCVYKISGLNVLDQSKTNNNNSVKDEFSDINLKLSKINYKDNDIKKNQELLQLRAKEYNRNKNIEYNLNLKLNTGDQIIRNKRRRILINKFLIKLMQRIIYTLLAISVPLGLYFLGYLSSKLALIYTSIIIIVMILIFSWIGNVNTNDIEDNSPLYKAKKINNFRFKDGYNSLFGGGMSGDNGENGEETLNSEISSELFNKCCNTESSEEYVESGSNVKSDCGFFYDKTLPYQIYI